MFTFARLQGAFKQLQATDDQLLEQQRLEKEKRREEERQLANQRKQEEQKKRLYEERRVKLIAAAQSGDMQALDALLLLGNEIDLLNMRDEDGNTAFHHAAAAGKFDTFCRLSQHLRAIPNLDFPQSLSQLINNKGQSPWHFAALFGHSDFFDLAKFTERIDRNSEHNEANEIWDAITNAWLNAADSDGDTPLHSAASMTPKMTETVLRNKKHVIAKLKSIPRLDFNHQNKKGKTALHIVAESGNYLGARELLKSQQLEEKKAKKTAKEPAIEAAEEIDDNENAVELKIINENNFSLTDNKQKKAGSLSVDGGHDRIRKLFEYYSARKSITGGSKQNDAFSASDTKALAKNTSVETEDVVKAMKPFIDEYDYEKIKNVAEVRLEALRKKNKRKVLWNALLGGACAALTLATVIGEFGGVLEPLIIGGVFLATFIPFAYTGYKAKMDQDRQEAEELYLSCAAVKIQDLHDKLTIKSAYVKKRLLEIEEKISKAESKDNIKNCQDEFASLEKVIKDVEKTKQELDKFYEPVITSPDKKPKVKLQFISQKDYEKKKSQAVRDPKGKAEWATRSERIYSFIAYKSDVLCTTGALIDILAMVGSIVISKVGLGFLGGGVLAGFLGGPFGIAAVTLVAAIALAAVVGVVLYKSTYKEEKEEAGESNRDLVFAHDRCRNADYRETAKLSSDLQRNITQTKDALSSKQGLINKGDILSGKKEEDFSLKPKEPTEPRSSYSLTRNT